MSRHVRRILVLATLAVAALAASAGSASAWQQVSEHGTTNTAEASVVRGADGTLHIVYKDYGAGSVSGIRYRTMNLAGVLGAPETALGGWNGVANPDIELIGGAPHVFFTGLQDINSANPFSSGQSWTTNRASGAWALSATPISSSNTPYSSTQLSSTIDGAGQPWTSSTTTFDVLVHTGFATSGTEANYRPTNGCCGYASNVGVDPATGAVWLAYYSNATDQVGYWMQQLAPTVGAPVLLPRVGNDSLSRGARSPLAPRIGGGLYTAYCDTYPSCTGIRLYAPGRTAIRLPLAAAVQPLLTDTVWVTAAPSGRLWLAWSSRSGVFVTRTNKAVTKFQPIQKVALPRNTDTPWGTAGEGSRGPLDLFAQLGITDAAGVTIQTWHQRVKPKLTLTAPLATVHSDRTRTVLLKLTDAGDPVVGTIRFRGVTRTTNARGLASFTVPAGTRTGSYVATGAATGYVANTARVRVHMM